MASARDLGSLTGEPKRIQYQYKYMGDIELSILFIDTKVHTCSLGGQI
jgi:hypothetical protein